MLAHDTVVRHERRLERTAHDVATALRESLQLQHTLVSARKKPKFGWHMCRLVADFCRMVRQQ
jgi:hypothetical protein